MFNFLHTFHPHPILFEFGWFKIHWYGLVIAIGAFLGFLAVLHLAKKYKVPADHLYNLAFYLLIFGLIGDRLYYVFYAWDYYSRHLLDIFKIWQGGLAIHGAMIAGLIVIFIYAKKYKLNAWGLMDLIVIALPLAMAFGRWGNYFNQELFGLPTNLPWGIPIEQAKRPAQFISQQYFHPTFLYESLWNMLIFVILFSWHKIRIAKEKTFDQLKGNIVIAYLILYSIFRFSNEFLRQDYSPYFLGLRWAQFISLVIIAVCFIIITAKIAKRFKHS